MYNLLAVEGVIRYGAIHGFADAQTIGVIGEACRRTGLVHACKLSAALPREGPAVVGEGIADIIVGDGVAVVRCQFVLPGGVVGIDDGF